MSSSETFDSQSHLTTGGGDDPFLPKLLKAINNASDVSLAVSFIKASGLSLLYDALHDAVSAGAKVRILTGDYLCITDPEALRSLLVIQELGADVRVFESKGLSFHMKAYIFTRSKNDQQSDGCAFVGSSNISKSALSHGLEWNLRVDKQENPSRFKEICNKFDDVFANSQSIPLTNEWIDNYAVRVLHERPEQAAFPGQTETLPPPIPNEVQNRALDALAKCRNEGNRRGLVVMATGTGKTWLAAFDTAAANAKRVLFVAHREEILSQAEETFVRIRPDASIGKYSGNKKELKADMVFASVQTIGKTTHLNKFPRDHFDYIIVDEFHHAAARTYRRLLAHFDPHFLLGLTATPDRTDQADILSLCDDNLVFTSDIFEGVQTNLLCPFHYYGIGDDTVDYTSIPWRNGKFDPNTLSSKLATTARARHVLKVWQKKKQSRTLAFCVSQRHADYMAEFANKHQVKSVAVHSESEVRRNDALEMLRTGAIDILFSVDLFNEGVDLPSIDTVLMLRPTESKIIFMQQLGRGLRTCVETGKEHLVVLDFIGNHISFFKKAEALLKIGKTNQERRKFLDEFESDNLTLPPGCYINYDIKAIEFMKELTKTNVDLQKDLYQSLAISLGHRPTLPEFYLAGGGVKAIQREYGQWFKFVAHESDLGDSEQECLSSCAGFFEEVESTQISKSFKMVLLEALIDLDGFHKAPSTKVLAERSHEILLRRRALTSDAPDEFQTEISKNEAAKEKWLKYWLKNPINAWIGGNTGTATPWFKIENNNFAYREKITTKILETFVSMLQELVDYRYEQYKARPTVESTETMETKEDNLTEIPFFSDLSIACGHFKSSTHDDDMIEYRSLPLSYGRLDPARHFIARAHGNSMDGGMRPIKNGDHLLLELITPTSAGSISNQEVAIERQDVSGDDQYLLRHVKKNAPGEYTLEAWNQDYEDIQATDEMKTFARLLKVIDPVDFILHQPLMRADIPEFFDLPFNKPIWETGHVCPKGSSDHFLLVTLNKQGQKADHKYHDYFINESTFHWQSQNSTKPSGKRGKDVIEHVANGVNIHLFVRKNKLLGKKAAPFYYCGKLTYKKHSGSNPMSVVWEMQDPLHPNLLESYGTKKD